MKYCHHPTGRHNKKRANEREIYALWFSCVGCSNATTHHPHSLTRSPPPYEKNINNFKARFSSRKICAYEKREREHCTHNDDGGGGVHVVVIFLTVIVLFLVVFLSLSHSLFTRILFLDFRSFWNFPPELNKMENFSKNKMLECHNNLASKEK